MAEGVGLLARDCETLTNALADQLVALGQDDADQAPISDPIKASPYTARCQDGTNLCNYMSEDAWKNAAQGTVHMLHCEILTLGCYHPSEETHKLFTLLVMVSHLGLQSTRTKSRNCICDAIKYWKKEFKCTRQQLGLAHKSPEIKDWPCDPKDCKTSLPSTFAPTKCSVNSFDRNWPMSNTFSRKERGSRSQDHACGINVRFTI